MSEEQKFSEISLENGVFETNLTAKYSKRKPFEKTNPRQIKAVIPGVVAQIDTAVGNVVTKGQPILILEAMKMLNRISAPIDGIVKAVRVSKGQKVAKGQILIELK